MDIPSWSFTNIGQSMMKIKPQSIKENPPETNADKIEDFLLNFFDLGFEMNLELFIELYI